MIYLTSDTHFFHDNIRKYCDRKFQSVYEMNDVLISNWNSVVKSDDEVYHLGDVAFGNPVEVQKILNKLNGKIYLVRGNHEKTILGSKCINRFEWVKDMYQFEYKSIVDEKTYFFVLCHFPFLTWNRSHKGSICGFGHQHNKINNPTVRRYDVGVDANDYTPISIEKLIEIMKPISFGVGNQ